jgi:hypothetical protein
LETENSFRTAKRASIDFSDPKAVLKSMVSEKHKERREATLSKSRERSFELY